MKKILCSFCLILLVVGLNAQTASNKTCVTAGFGFQQYKGDLANDFYKFHWTKYGVASATLGFYINKTFDFNFQMSVGDFGYCQSSAEADRWVDADLRCPGCKNRVGLGNLNSRMTSGGIAIKYKFANGYLLKENARIAPYIYMGAGINHITDRMKMNCVCPGDYSSINAGVGFRYNVCEKFNIGYNVALGCFSSSNLDYITGKKDMYLQNTLFLGYNFK